MLYIALAFLLKTYFLPNISTTNTISKHSKFTRRSITYNVHHHPTPTLQFLFTLSYHQKTHYRQSSSFKIFFLSIHFKRKVHSNNEPLCSVHSNRTEWFSLVTLLVHLSTSTVLRCGTQIE